MSLSIYTDGSCLVKSGKGGWAYCILLDEDLVCDSAPEINTTNNRMELTAVIEALNKNPIEDCHIFTDSKWVMNCAQGLWKRKKNLDLWEKYDTVSKSKNINWTWVRGHSGDYYNEIVDKLAQNAARSI